MTRLANLTTLADASAARPLLTSAQVQAFNGHPLTPCPRLTCNSIQLALSHRGDWFCPECSAWLAGVTVPCPDELPPVAALFWSVDGLAVSELEISRGPLCYINAVIFPDGEVIYPLGRVLPEHRRWWEVEPENEARRIKGTDILDSLKESD